MTLTMARMRSNNSLLPGFLTASLRKNQPPSVVSSGATASLTLATDDCETLMQDLGVDEASTHSANSILHSPRSLGLSRAASYLMRRTFSRKSTMLGEEHEKEPIGGVSEAGHIDDIFASELNRCSTSTLPELRLQRAELYPIICYESDEEDSDGRNENSTHEDVGLVARLEALKVQERLLGKDHTDVIFLSRRIQRLRGTSELLRLSLERGCTTSSRAHYLPKSAHMIVPSDYPVQ